MAKYKVGDKVRLLAHKPNHPGFVTDMEKYLGKTLTVRSVVEIGNYTHYTFEEAYSIPTDGCYWCFLEAWIAGLAEPQTERHGDNDLSVVIRFCGNKTTARLMRGETIVKTATARRNPADNYSRAEGARVAVERLFAKKRNEDKPKESKPKVGDKFVVTGNHPYGECHHHFKTGEIVTLANPEIFRKRECLYKNRKGLEQYVRMEDVRPYKGESK